MKRIGVDHKALLWTALIVLVVVIVCTVDIHCQEIVVYEFKSPGAGGMASNYDLDLLDPTQSPYLLNADVTSKPGVVRRRAALVNYGGNTTPLYGAFGYYNSLTGHKQVIGVTDHATYSIGQLVVSDTFGTEVGADTISGNLFPFDDVRHDWTPYKDFVIHADGNNTPFIYTTSETFYYDAAKSDTFGYSPHVISMGLEAPGQPRVGMFSDAGNLNGRYTYAFAYSSGSAIGPVSRPITVSDQNIYISNFPTGGEVNLLRKSGQGDNLWYLVHTTTVTTEGFVYVDSLTDIVRVIRVEWYRGDTAFYDTLPSTSIGWYKHRWAPGSGYIDLICCDEPAYWDSVGYRIRSWNNDTGRTCSLYSDIIGDYCKPLTYLEYDDSTTTDVDSFTVDTFGTTVYEPSVTGRRPGQFVRYDSLGAAFIDSSATVHYTAAESLYYIAYAYYDPVTGIESPLGPLLGCSLSLKRDDSLFATYYAYDGFDTILNPTRLRVYQTLTKTTLAGAGDSTVLYGLLELRPQQSGVVSFGSWNDNDVVAGLDTSYAGYYPYQMFRNDIGGVVVVPPYHYDCQIPFSDIEYLAGQFWGIGDPDNKNRVYYSQYDAPLLNIFSWPETWFVQFLEIGNDELVALERAEGYGDDAMYVFAHNSVWLMDQYGDYQAISTRVGAASRAVVIKKGEVVYFVAPNMRIYAMSGPTLQEISKPIQDYVESVLVSFEVVSNYNEMITWGHAIGDYVRWFSDSTGLGLSFNTKPEAGTWTIAKYGDTTYVPRGSILYDTISSGGATVGLTPDVELLYTDSAIRLRRESAVGGWEKHQPYFEVQTPFMGTSPYNWQIQQIEVLGRSIHTGFIKYEVINTDDTAVVVDSFAFTTGDNVKAHTFQPSYNMDRLLSLKFSIIAGGAATDPSDSLPAWLYMNYDFMQIRVWLQNMGLDNVH